MGHPDLQPVLVADQRDSSRRFVSASVRPCGPYLGGVVVIKILAIAIGGSLLIGGYTWATEAVASPGASSMSVSTDARSKPFVVNLTINGLPSGVTASVTLAGPTRTIKATTSGKKVVRLREPGVYTWTASDVLQDGTTYRAVPSSGSFRAVAGKARAVNIKYSAVTSSSPSYLFQTLPLDSRNSDFRAWPLRWPQLAQWLQIDKDLSIKEVTFRVGAAEVATPGWWSDKNRWDLVNYVDRGFLAIQAHVALWKRAEPGEPPADFDLSSGFSLVAEANPTKPIQLGTVTMNFPNTISLTPGTYVLVIGFKTDDPDVLMVFVDGQQSGNNRKDSNGEPTQCDYTPTPDSYPPGAAYITSPINNSLVRGVQAPFGTAFTRDKAKVIECVEIGRYSDVYNQGDLIVALR